MTISPQNITCITHDKQDIREVNNYGGQIMLKKLGITDCKQEQLGSRLKQCCSSSSNSGGDCGGGSNSSSGRSSSNSSSKGWRTVKSV